MTHNSNEALGGLSEEQREKVREWTDEGVSARGIVTKAGQAEPEGFGVTLSKSAVDRFQRNYRSEKMKEGLGDDEQMAVELLEKAGRGQVDFRGATIQVLQRKVFSAAAESKGEQACEMLRKLMEMDQRQQRIDVARKNHELSRFRFEINTSRELLKKAAIYVDIHQARGIDAEEKVRAAREICFGNLDQPAAAEPAVAPAGLLTEGNSEAAPEQETKQTE